MTVRIAYGSAAGTWGGPSVSKALPHHLTAADFTLQLDAYDLLLATVNRDRSKLEKRPAAPTTMAEWIKSRHEALSHEFSK